MFPTSLGLIGRPHGVRGEYHELTTLRVDSAMTLVDAPCRRDFCDGGPPAEPTPNWRPRAGVTSAAAHARSGQPAALIGRQGARESFWDATLDGVAVGTPAGALAEPAYVFGAAGRRR